MVCHRLCRARYARTALDGDGPRLYGGRWSLRGTRMVYAAQTLSLAALEVLVHVDHLDAPDDFVSTTLMIPDGVKVERWTVRSLPSGWKELPGPERLQEMGSAWADSGRTAVLQIPSAVIPDEWNFLLNPLHRDFRRIKAGPPRPFRFDPRLQ